MPGNLDSVRYQGREIRIGPQGVVIGRDPSCELVIDLPAVSRRHARIYNNSAGCWIQDLGSRNSTLVNGALLGGQPVPLSSGDRLRFGDAEVVVLRGAQTTFGALPQTERSLPGSVPLTGQPVTIGRDPTNVVTLDDPNVSRFHAVLEPRPEGVMLRDRGSRNGTRVNGEAVTRVWLRPADQVAIGPFRFTFTGAQLEPIDQRNRLRLTAEGVTMSVGAKRLLEPIDLTIEPGELVAIIGESGAGKTTLLRALAGVTKPTGGTVLINDEPIAARLTDVGYVPQEDIVHRLLTLREALRYTAQLRLPGDTTSQEIDAAVAQVVGELDLVGHEDTLVGRLSGGQRKRAGVAAELLSRPGIIFLDEPATGLDPGLEKKLMQLLRKLSDGGRPIITITHSTASLPLVNKLIVMGRGGVLCYAGPPADALGFFGVSTYDEIYTALDEAPPGHWQRAFQQPRAPQGAPGWSRFGTVRGMRPAPAAMPTASRQPAVLPQAFILARRNLKLKLRDARNLAILFGQAPILGVMIAIGFPAAVFKIIHPAGPALARAPLNPQTPTLLLEASLTIIWLGTFAGSREIVKERAVFLRERSIGVSVRAYMLGKLSILILITLIQVALLLGVLLAMRPLHLPAKAYLEVAGVAAATSFSGLGMGLLISALSTTEDQPGTIIPLVLIPQLIFNGIVIPFLHKALYFKVIAALMLARWSGAGLGTAARLKDTPGIKLYYGTLFSHPLLPTVGYTLATALICLVLVCWQLTRETI